jgi:hypothetical protein
MKKMYLLRSSLASATQWAWPPRESSAALFAWAGRLHRTSFGKISSEGRRPDASTCPRVRKNVQVGRPSADGMNRRPVGSPGRRHPVDGCRTACCLPRHSADGMADGDPTAGWTADGRSVHRSRWQSAGRQTVGRTTWRTPPPRPSARGRPPQGCHKGRFWRKITNRTSFSSGRPPESAFTPRTRFYPRTDF